MLKNLLIIYPHWHPANLAGVQRPRLIGNFLKEYGWNPRVLTVDSSYFEEEPDNDFRKTFSKDFQVTRVKALPIFRPRLIGDVGIRAFYSLYNKAISIIQNESIDFIWLPIPSFYNALLGRLLFDKTGVQYGVDYIDPWVRDITNQNNFRAKLSQLVARRLEPIAIKKASLISGVSTAYYQSVLKRNFPNLFNTEGYLEDKGMNPHTNSKLVHVGMPYGFDPNDHKVKLPNLQTPWDKSKKEKIWLYAGAFLPNSHYFLELMFSAISRLRSEGNWDESIRLYFIGTGSYPAKRITSYAQDFGLSDIVIEYRQRFPFLHILNFLNQADRVLVIGSTEKHYTASKTYQVILSEKPVFAIFHEESSAVTVLEECESEQYLVKWQEDLSDEKFGKLLTQTLKNLQIESVEWNPNYKVLEKYSAKASAGKLVEAIESCL